MNNHHKSHGHSSAASHFFNKKAAKRFSIISNFREVVDESHPFQLISNTVKPVMEIDEVKPKNVTDRRISNLSSLKMIMAEHSQLLKQSMIIEEDEIKKEVIDHPELNIHLMRIKEIENKIQFRNKAKDLHLENIKFMDKITQKQLQKTKFNFKENHSVNLHSAPQIKRIIITGSSEIPPKCTQEGYLESKFRFYKLQEHDFKSKDEFYHNNQDLWTNAIRKALETGEGKTINDIFPRKYIMQKRITKLSLKKTDFNPRYKWAYAIFKIIKLIRSVKSSFVIPDQPRTDKSLVSQLKDFQMQLDLTSSAKMQHMLSIPPTRRSEKEVHYLNTFLFSKIKSFSKYTVEQRAQFCRVMEYATFEKGRQILKEGHFPIYFYFIFSGKVEIFKNRTDGIAGQNRVTSLTVGDSFGSVALEGLGSDIRTASVICLTPCVFFIVDKEDYKRIASGQITVDQIAYRLSVLREMEIFRNSEESELTQIATKMKVKYVPQDTVIVQENIPCTRIFFVSSGTIELKKKIKIIQQEYSNGKIKYLPYVDGMKLKKNQMVIEQEVSYGTIQQGGFFPELVKDGEFQNGMFETALNLNRKKLIGHLSYIEPRNLNKSFGCCSSMVPSVLIEISKLDLSKLASGYTLQRVVDGSLRMSATGVSELQESFVLSKNWNLYKKEMNSKDSDLRFMALTDLNSRLSQRQKSIQQSETQQLASAVLLLLTDTNSAIQNLSIQTLLLLSNTSTLTKEYLLKSLTKLLSETSPASASSSNLQLQSNNHASVASLAIKSIISHSESFDFDSITNILSPSLALIINPKFSVYSHEQITESLDIITKILQHQHSNQYPSPLNQNSSLEISLWSLILNSNPSIRKKSIITLATLSCVFDDVQFSTCMAKTHSELLCFSKTPDKGLDSATAIINLISTITKLNPTRVSIYSKDFLPLLISLASLNSTTVNIDDVVEQSISAIESFVVYCPCHISEFIRPIINSSLSCLKYDPNYNYEHDMDIDDEDDHEDDDEDDEDYSDDEDMSWKIRKASAKLLGSIFNFKNDCLPEFYNLTADLLVSRFTERVESVRLEIISAFICLVNQTTLSSNLQKIPRKPSSLSITGNEIKKKKCANDTIITSSENLTVQDSQSKLQSMVPFVCTQISKHIVPKIKSFPTALADFSLLKAIAECVPTSLDHQVSDLQQILKISFSASEFSNANLRIGILQFINSWLTLSNSNNLLPFSIGLVEHALESTNNRSSKISKEAFSVLNGIIKIMAPLDSVSRKSFEVETNLKKIFETIYQKCSSSDTDTQVREEALLCLGELVYSAADVIGSEIIHGRVFKFLLEKLQNETTRLVVIKVICRITESPLDGKTLDFGSMLSDFLVTLSSFMRKSNQQLRLAALQCIKLLLQKYQNMLVDDAVKNLLSDLISLLSESDLQILTTNILVICLVVQHSKKTDFIVDETKNKILPKVIEIISTAPHLLLSEYGIEAMKTFWNVVIETGGDEVRDYSIKMLLKLGSSDKLNQSINSVSAKSISYILENVDKSYLTSVVQNLVSEFKSSNSSISKNHFSLHSIGEIGCRNDLSKIFPDMFETLLESFSSTSEDIKYAAAFSLGNYSLGNIDMNLPKILQSIDSHDQNRYLLFITLKEVISKLFDNESGLRHLKSLGPTIWNLLLRNTQDVLDDTIRNAIAECIGKIALFDPATYIDQLQVQINSGNPNTKATVITALRYTFIESTEKQQEEFDTILSSVLYDFLKHIGDSEILVQKSSLATFTSAAHHKPQLVGPLLNNLLPLLYKACTVKEELIHIVEMGPFKHRVDDGLESRKARAFSAYECMYTLIDSCFLNIEIFEFIKHVISGMSDESSEILILSYLILQRLSSLSPMTIAQNLDEFVVPLKKSILAKPKSNAVKQELERGNELVRSATRTLIILSKLQITDSTHSEQFKLFLESVKISAETREMFSEVELELSKSGNVLAQSGDYMDIS